MHKCFYYVYLCDYGLWLYLKIVWFVYIIYFQISVFCNQFINLFKMSVFTNLCVLSFGLSDI